MPVKSMRARVTTGPFPSYSFCVLSPCCCVPIAPLRYASGCLDRIDAGKRGGSIADWWLSVCLNGHLERDQLEGRIEQRSRNGNIWIQRFDCASATLIRNDLKISFS